MAKSASATAKALDRLANSSDRANQRADKLCRCEAYDAQEAVLSTYVSYCMRVRGAIVQTCMFLVDVQLELSVLQAKYDALQSELIFWHTIHTSPNLFIYATKFAQKTPRRRTCERKWPGCRRVRVHSILYLSIYLKVSPS